MNEILDMQQDIPEEFIRHLRTLIDIYENLRTHTGVENIKFNIRERKQCVDFLETLIREEKDFWKRQEQKEFDKRQLDLFHLDSF